MTSRNHCLENWIANLKMIMPIDGDLFNSTLFRIHWIPTNFIFVKSEMMVAIQELHFILFNTNN